MTQLQMMLLEKYAKDEPWSKKESMVLLSVGMGAREFGFEEEIIAYLNAHPNATLQELDEYAAPFFPEIIIVDKEGHPVDEERYPKGYLCPPEAFEIPDDDEGE